MGVGRWCPRDGPTKAEVAVEAGQLVMDVLRPRPAPQRHHHPRGPRERDRRDRHAAAARPTACCTCSRVAREAGVDARHRRLRPRSASARRCCATSSPAGASSPSTSTTPAASRWSRSACSEAGLLHDDAPTVTGRTIGEHAAEAVETEGQEVVRPLSDPIKPTGGLAILRGNLAPEGCVVKLAGHERRRHDGPARVFESEEDAMAAVTGRARSTPATSSSSATRARPAAPACARCSPSPRRSSARASARRSRCSPTGASPARRTASWPGTSPPRRCAAARSPPSATATRSPSTSTPGASTSRWRTTRSPRGSPPTSRRRRPTTSGVMAKYAKLVSSASEGAVTG